jgi:heme-degrading monooxygenase HmoA
MLQLATLVSLLDVIVILQSQNIIYSLDICFNRPKMAYLLVRHTVKDYAKWKPFFDGHQSTRKKSGSKGGRLYRNSQNPNEIIIVMEWDTLDNARKFAESADLREVMEKAGVTGKPDVYFLEQVESFSN